MYFGKIIFSQIIDHLPMHTFRRCVNRYHGHYKVKHFSCWDQYLCMVFAQLTYRESLRDIQACLRAQQSKLYHIGIRAKVSRNTLANANKVRDWRIYADLAQSLIHMARRLYSHEDFGVQLDETVYALDATTIDLCLSVFPWATSAKPRPPSNSIRCWICAATSPPSFISATENCTTSTSSTNSCPSPARSTLWIAAIWTSKDYIRSAAFQRSS